LEIYFSYRDDKEKVRDVSASLAIGIFQVVLAKKNSLKNQDLMAEIH
jgi:hypothetical protein